MFHGEDSPALSTQAAATTVKAIAPVMRSHASRYVQPWVGVTRETVVAEAEPSRPRPVMEMRPDVTILQNWVLTGTPYSSNLLNN